MPDGHKSPTVFFDCRGCGWSCGANNEQWAVDVITAQIRDHLLYDSRHCGVEREPGDTHA